MHTTAGRRSRSLLRTASLTLVILLLSSAATAGATAAKGGNGRDGQGKGPGPREYALAPPFMTWYNWHTCEGLVLSDCSASPEYAGGRLEVDGTFDLWSRTTMAGQPLSSEAGYEGHSWIALGELSKVEVVATIDFSQAVADARTFPVASGATIELGMVLEDSDCEPCPSHVVMLRSADTLLGPDYEAGAATVRLSASFAAATGEKLAPDTFVVRQWVTLTARSAAVVDDPVGVGQAQALATGTLPSVVLTAHP